MPTSQAAEADEAAEEAVSRLYSGARAWASKQPAGSMSCGASGRRVFESIFSLIDSDSSGAFTEVEFRAGVRSMGINLNEQQVQAVFRLLDEDNGGSIDSFEFIETMETIRSIRAQKARHTLAALCNHLSLTDKSVADVFRQLDQDGSGELDLPEFQVALCELLGRDVSEGEAMCVMEELDQDGQGSLDLLEISESIDRFRRSRRAFSARILQDVLTYVSDTRSSVAQMFSRVDLDGSGDLDPAEFGQALALMGIEVTELEAEEVLGELDIDGSMTIEASEFQDKLKAFGRMNAEDKQRARAIFSEVDSDGSGSLDISEVREVALRMGFDTQLESIPNFLEQIMEEMDLNAAGGPELESDWLAQTRRVRCDGGLWAWGLGVRCVAEMDEAELRALLNEVAFAGIGEAVSIVVSEAESSTADSWAFVTFANSTTVDLMMLGQASVVLNSSSLTKFVVDMPSNEELNNCDQTVRIMMKKSEQDFQDKLQHGLKRSSHLYGDGKVTAEEFELWYMSKGKFYLGKQHFTNLKLSLPNEQEQKQLFSRIDSDGSGELNKAEIQDAVRELWPAVQDSEVNYAWEIADNDGSGLLDFQEFGYLTSCIVFLNKNRHIIAELSASFGQIVAFEDFFAGCRCLLHNVPSPDEAVLAFNRLTGETEAQTTDQDDEENTISFSRFIVWVTKQNFQPDSDAAQSPDDDLDEVELEQLQEFMNDVQGEYGDVHLQDLTGAMAMKAQPKRATQSMNRHVRRLLGMINRAHEAFAMIKKALRFMISKGGLFPDFQDKELALLARRFRKLEYFVGQNITTQAVQGDDFVVIKRGKADVLIDEKRVFTLQWGMGLGEVALMLGTLRTATVRCITPCEVLVLSRDDYNVAISEMDPSSDARTSSGDLVSIIDRLWELCTGPDGSRQPSVDFSTYLKLHINVAKALMSSHDEDDFDEAEERTCSRIDWEEDCARYKMKITDHMSRAIFNSAMYQLVDLWAGEKQVSYAQFMEWLFDVIAEWYAETEPHHWRFRRVKSVQCSAEKFDKLKNDAKSVTENFIGESVTSAADNARERHAEENMLRAEQIKREKLEEERREQQAMDLARAESLARTRSILADRVVGCCQGLLETCVDQLRSLDSEEVELRRRLEGNLTAEEEATIRDRLAEIERVREALWWQQRKRLSEISSQLKALDDEEAELRRRLDSSGELTAEEQAALRARLTEIERIRNDLMIERGGLGDVLAAQAQVFADEAAQLRQRLATGGLSVEEESAVRARLVHLDVIKSKSGQYQQGVVDALESVLETLDDEEAELRRRLAAGGLTSDAEAQIRARLSEIDEISSSTNRMRETVLRGWAKIKAISGLMAVPHLREGVGAHLKALDDEEAELRRRLDSSGELTAEEQAALRARLTEIERIRNDLTPEPHNGMATTELQTVLQHLKPTKAMRTAAARCAAAELRASKSEAELFATSRTFKPLQKFEHHRIQPLWPSLTRGTWRPIDKPDTAVLRGVRPRSNGRPGTMISLSTYGGADKMRSDLSRHCQRHVFAHPQHHDEFAKRNSPERHRRASLSTPGGRHKCEVVLHGAASSITSPPTKLDPITRSCRRTALPQLQLGTDTVLPTGRTSRRANQRLAYYTGAFPDNR